MSDGQWDCSVYAEALESNKKQYEGIISLVNNLTKENPSQKNLIYCVFAESSEYENFHLIQFSNLSLKNFRLNKYSGIFVSNSVIDQSDENCRREELKKIAEKYELKKFNLENNN
jgi:predicted DNA-binding helix-hairpin-helix protein